jgi:hypothetical protein
VVLTGELPPLPQMDAKSAKSADVALFVAATPTNGASWTTGSRQGREFAAAGARVAEHKLPASAQVCSGASNNTARAGAAPELRRVCL